jgi:3-isopropylmalate/(R)-2-methylmalate dehydratase small subunit
MEKFIVYTGLAAILDRANVDTDLMVPKQFLTRIERAGFGEVLFNNIRYLENGDPNPEFILNQPRYKGAGVLVARENFGCGSSREHAPWALREYGFRAIISPQFADIFFTNCCKIGLLPATVTAMEADDLMRRVEKNPGYEITVDLPAQRVAGSDGFIAKFEIDPFRKEMLHNGWDEISLTLNLEEQISSFEKSHPVFSPREPHKRR